MKQLGFFIAISLIFHFLISTSTLYFAEKYQVQNAQNKPVEIEVLDQQPVDKFEKTKQLIRQLKNTVQELKDSKLMARFESEKTQRVIKETRARQLGLTQNSAAQQLQRQQQFDQSHPTTENKLTTQKDGDLPEFARSRTAATQIAISQESAISSTMPSDIQQSNATNLNTDANIYYSFYSRVEELFYVRWVERNNYYWDRINYDYKKNVLAGKTWSTSIEVWLTSKGEFHSAYIKQSSGYKPFDEATIFAFQDAKFFPNPPKAKVESDGFVRLKYRFNVNVASY